MSTVDVTLFLSEDLLIKQVCPDSNPFECISSRSLLNKRLPELLVRNEQLRRDEEPADSLYENGKEFSGILKLEQHPPRDSYHVQCRYVQLAATEHLPYNSLITMKITDKEKEARDHIEGMIEKSQGVSQLLHETRIAKARLNCLTEGIRHAIVVEDRDRRVVVANDRFKECFHIPLFVDLVGSDCSDGLAQAKDLFVDGETAIKRVEEILRNREGVYGEEVLMSNGIIYERDYSPIFIDNTYEGHLWLYHDITSLKLYSLVSSINLLGQMLISSSTSKIFDSVPKFLQDKFRFRAVAIGLSENDGTAVKLVSSVGFNNENDTEKIKATMLETIATKTNQLRQGILHCVLMSSSDHGIVGALLVELKDKEDGHHQILNNIGSLLADTILRERWRDELSEARDRALAAVKAKSQFMANLSHELRTPLSVVLGLCDLLSHTALNAEQHDYVVNIQKSSSILFNVINQILDFSKSEASVIGVNEVRFSPRSKIEDIMMMMSSHAEANKLKMNFYLPACFDKEVIGDNVKLEQIMINLLGNAIKFTKNGSVTLQGELVRSDITEQEWKIEVVDTGIGVDEASSSKLFQPFTQLDGSSSRKYGGTGLGLAISKLLVEKLGGQIGHCNVKQNGNVIGSNFWFTFKTKPVPFHDIEPARFMVPAEMCLALNMKENCHTSVLKRYLNEWGATIVNTNDNRRCATIITKKMYSAMSDEELNKDTFIVLTSHPKVMQTAKANIYFAQIPYVVSNLKMVLSSAFNKAPVQSVQSESDNNRKQEPSEKTDKILVVEDNVMNRKVIVKLLEKEGYKNVLWAENGLEALKLFNEHLFRLVFMDCQMPLMDGYEATRQIRKIENNERHVPIIALTANASEQDAQECLAVGMDEYLAKPINQRALSQALNKIKT